MRAHALGIHDVVLLLQRHLRKAGAARAGHGAERGARGSADPGAVPAADRTAERRSERRGENGPAYRLVVGRVRRRRGLRRGILLADTTDRPRRRRSSCSPRARPGSSAPTAARRTPSTKSPPATTATTRRSIRLMFPSPRSTQADLAASLSMQRKRVSDPSHGTASDADDAAVSPIAWIGTRRRVLVLQRRPARRRCRAPCQPATGRVRSARMPADTAAAPKTIRALIARVLVSCEARVLAAPLRHG